MIAATVSAAAVAFVAGCDRASDGEARAAVSPAPAPSASVQEQPAEIGQWIETVRRECAEAGGRFDGISDHLLPGDFNGDGRVDYVLMWGGVQCPHPEGWAAGAMGWGNAGPDNDFLISQPDGGYRIFDGFMSTLSQENLVRRGDRDVLVFEGTWFQPGGEVHKVTQGWTGQGIGVIERQDAQGRQVDEDGYLVRAAAPAASGALPFREGRYVGEGTSCDDEYAESKTITASEFVSNNLADSDVCRVDSRQVNGDRVRLTIRCEVGCGNGYEGECPVEYGPPGAVDIQAENRTVITITGNTEYWNGRHRYCRAAQ